jgi:signal peptidase I
LWYPYLTGRRLRISHSLSNQPCALSLDVLLMLAVMPITNSESISACPAAAPLRRKARVQRRSILQQSFQLLAALVLAAASYFLISQFLLQSVKVVGRSMVPTLYDSERYLLNRWVYHVHAPRHSDVVVLRDPSDNGFSVKRIIAVPGDSIYLKDGSVYVNGCKLNEGYLAPGTPTFTDSKYANQLILCGKDHYFLLGDNRKNSVDSRTYGPVPRRNIVGPIIR